MTRYTIRHADGRILTVMTHEKQYVHAWQDDPHLGTSFPSMTEALMMALTLQLSGDYFVEPIATIGDAN